MNKFLIILLLIVASCTTKKASPSNQVTDYYNGFKNSNYEQIRKTIADSMTITEGPQIMPFTPESFYEQFKWDSVFKPVYNLKSIKEQGEHIVATVSVSSLRFEFLKNNPLETKQKFHFKSGKISKVENLDFIGVNWEIWQKQVNTLVSWTAENHPEFDGFINDLSMNGGLDYLKAIELYSKRQQDTIE